MGRRLSAVEKFHLLHIAEELVRLGARTHVAVNCTGLQEGDIKSVHQAIHNKSTSSGRRCERLVSAIRSKRGFVHASTFLNLYVKECGGEPEARRAINPTALLAAFRQYLFLEGEAAELDINLAWLVARDFRSHYIERKYCSRCKSYHLESTEGLLGYGCPMCDIRNRVGRKSVVAAG